MEATEEESDDSGYQKIFATLDELKLGFLRPFFKKHFLEDDTLLYMKSEDELRNELKELGLLFGQAFKFSRHWFANCHKYKEKAITNNKSGADNRDAQPEEVLSKVSIKCSRNVQGDAERSGLKETQESTANDEASISCETKEKIDSVRCDKSKTQQRGNENQFERQSKLEQLHFTQHEKDGDDQNASHPASKESQEQNTEGNREISNGSNEIFLNTTVQDKNEHDEDGRARGTQQGSHLDPQTLCPKNPPISSKQKEAQNSKKQPNEAVQSKNKHTLKGVVSTDGRKADYAPEGSESDNFIQCIPKSDTNNNSMSEKPSSSDTVCVPSQSTGTAVTGERSVLSTSSFSEPQIAGLSPTGPQKDEAKKQSLSVNGHEVQSVHVSKCIRRPFGVKVTGNSISYKKGSVLYGEESKEVEYKSFSSAHPSILPWKIMEKAKKFICACLNAGSKGTIYFGVGDNQEQGSKFHHGEVIGLEVENIKDDITKALQFLLDVHIKSDDGQLQKGGEQNCIDIHFVPVEFQGNHSNLYVVEIEVYRDWRFCKDKLYHSKTWEEKGGKDSKQKKGLNDLFKVKDRMDDIAVRTKGASICVKQDEVQRQVREPLETKYKEWKRETKFGASEPLDGYNPDDPDFKRINKMVRKRLFHLNSKEYHYLLVANKVPPQYRGTPHLSFLQSIPWVAVFDLFDASSKADGLHFICNEMTDARRANIKTLDDFNDVLSNSSANKDGLISTRGTTWVLQAKKLQDEEWITSSSKDCFYKAISAYKQCLPSGRLIIAILGLGENAMMEMSDIVESCFSILGGEIAKKCVTIISESKAISDALIKTSKPALRKQLVDCTITDISWNLLKEIVREMVGPNEFKEKEATTKLPYITGEREVLNKIINSWDDLEVYSPEPRLQSLTEDIEKNRDAFYKGSQASQVNLFYNHTIERTLEEEIIEKVEQAIKSLGNSNSDRTFCVKAINVPYEPGSGATTLCRRILWKKRKDHRCAVIKAITKATDFQIQQLQGICYHEEQQNYSPPVLVLVDNFPELDIRVLSERLTTRETKCVIIATYPVKTTGPTIEFAVEPLGQLNDSEMGHVRNILINITRDSGRRREAEEVLEREKRFIWFGLELFGREYVKIKERLQNHIDSTLACLGNSHARYEKLLQLCCFLHVYSNGAYILPHSFVGDFLYEASDETEKTCTQTSFIHDKFGGLLLKGFNESYGYHGWRPAHSLVSEVVKTKMNVDKIAVHLLENAGKGRAYANKYLWEQLFQILLHRERVSNLISLPQDEETPEDNIESDIATDDQKCYEVRTRYSPLILDIIAADDGHRRTLELLITVCQKAKQTEHEPYAWQQLARFLGYEMRFKPMEREDTLHNRLYDVINMSKSKDHQIPMPETGIQAAHIAIDIAIDQQPKTIHHYTTKGLLYRLQLRDVSNNKDEHNLISSMSDVIDIGRKALKVYDQAIQRKRELNFYSVNGKIEIIVLLLKIFKSLPCFGLENNSFTRYLEVGEIPREMEGFFQQEDHSFVQNLGRITLNLFNELFKDVKYRQLTTCDDNEFRSLSTTNTRACKLREEFYEITEFDRSKLMPSEEPLSPSTEKEPHIIQQVVQDILFKKNETPYSSWSHLDNEIASSIYRLLKPICLQGNGNHNDMLIFSRVCLRLSDQTKPSVDELDSVVQTWVKKFPDSAWAHLFNYMIHFPIPNRSLLPTDLVTLASINKCCEMVQKTKGWRARKSAAEYFLGKGTGLIAIVSRQQFPELEKKWGQTKTDFWRSKEVSETLIRVRGQKLSQGVITYQGIRLRFDDMLYPSESKDDLWFYVGFSVAGPYAFDPVNDDSYFAMTRKRENRTRPFKRRASNDFARNAVYRFSPRRQKPRKMSGSNQRNPHNSELADKDVDSTVGIKRAKTALKKCSFKWTKNAAKHGVTCSTGPGRHNSRTTDNAIQRRFPTTSLGKNVQQKVPSRHSNVPREPANFQCHRSTFRTTRLPLTRNDMFQRPVAEATCELVNSSPCLRFSDFPSRSALTSDNNFQKPAVADAPHSSAVLKNKGANKENDIPNADVQAPKASVAQKVASSGVRPDAPSVFGQSSRKTRGRGKGIQIRPHASEDHPGRNCLKQLPSDLLINVQKEYKNSMSSSSSATRWTQSPLASDDNLQKPVATSIHSSCASQLIKEGASQEKETPDVDRQSRKAFVTGERASNAVGPGAIDRGMRKPRGRGRGIQRSPRAFQSCPTSTIGRTTREQLHSANLYVPNGFVNSSPCSTSIPRPAITANTLKYEGTSQEKEVANSDSQPPEALMVQNPASNAVGTGGVSVTDRESRKLRGIGRGSRKTLGATAPVLKDRGVPCGKELPNADCQHPGAGSTPAATQRSVSNAFGPSDVTVAEAPSTLSTMVSNYNHERAAANAGPHFCESAVKQGDIQENHTPNIDDQSKAPVAHKAISNFTGSCAVSVTGKGSQTPREMGIQKRLDASKDSLTTPPCQNANERVHVPKWPMNSSPCFGSTPSFALSSLTSDDNLLPVIPPYPSFLKHGTTSKLEKKPNADAQPPDATATQKEIDWKSVKGTRGEDAHVFQPMYVDQKGKLHHGSRVLGAFKSQECSKHTGTLSSWNINRCTFAHSWRGDIIQSVCTKCTEEDKPVCREKEEHEQFIWNLGPYYNEYGNIWKDSSGPEPSK